MIETKKEIPLIKDLIKEFKGFFYYIPYKFPDFVDKTVMDFLFYSNYFDRRASPLVAMRQKNSTFLSSDDLDLIGVSIELMYHTKWDKYFALLNLDYNPMYNYSDTYSETTTNNYTDTKDNIWNDDKTNTRTDDFSTQTTNDLSETHSGNITEDKTRTDNLTQTTDNNLSEIHSGTITDELSRTDNLSDVETALNKETTTNTNNNDVYGFNSSLAVNDTKSDATTIDDLNVSDTILHTGTQNTNDTTTDNRIIKNEGLVTNSNTGTQVNKNITSDGRVISNTGTINKKDTGTQTNVINNIGKENMKLNHNGGGTKDYTHIGNIGNHTTQRLIRDEIELWRWKIIEDILHDVADFTTIPFYF